MTPEKKKMDEKNNKQKKRERTRKQGLECWKSNNRCNWCGDNKKI